MKRLLNAVYRWLHDPRYLGFFGIRVPEDEEWCTYPEETRTEGKAIHLGDIYFAADYERDLKHDTGEDEFETWIARNQEEDEEWK